MDLLHMHLMLNHLPIVGVMIGFLVLLAGVIWRSRPASMVGTLLLIMAAIVSIPVYLTGRSSEDIVEGLPGVTESVIDQHEGAAVASLALVTLTGVFALAALLLSRKRSPALRGYLVMITLFMSLLASTSMFRTANLGGQIRHTEIRSGANASSQDRGRSSETKGHREAGDDDDDR